MQSISPKNRGLVIFMGSMQILLFIIYGSLVDPSTSGNGFNWFTILTVIFCLGYLYVANHQRQFIVNILGNWLIMWFISFQLYFLFITMWASVEVGKSINPSFSSAIVTSTNLPILMLTIAYVNLKGFLGFKEVVILTIVGVFGFSTNQYFLFYQLEGIDAGSLSIFMFGAVYGFVVRVIAIPTRSFSPLNKFIQITRDQAIAAFFVCLFYFPMIASITDDLGSLAAANVFLSVVCSLIASITLHIAMNLKIQFQTLLYTTIAASIIILITPGLIQNISATAIVGTSVGLAYSYTRTMLPAILARLKIPDPSLTAILFVLPATIGTILSSIFIACYNIKSYNHLGYTFPYVNVLLHPFKYGAMQFAVIIVNTLMAVATGLLAGYLMKWLSEMNELQEQTLFWSEQSPGNQSGDSGEPLLAHAVADEPVYVAPLRQEPEPVVQYATDYPQVSKLEDDEAHD